MVCFSEWEDELDRYSGKHPHMRVIDTMDAIRPIMSRLSMLAPFGDHGIHLKARLTIPVFCYDSAEHCHLVIHNLNHKL